VTYYVAWVRRGSIPNLGVFRDSVEQALYGEQIVIWWQTVAYAGVYTAATAGAGDRHLQPEKLQMRRLLKAQPSRFSFSPSCFPGRRDFSTRSSA
jgi:hypothetical protein